MRLLFYLFLVFNIDVIIVFVVRCGDVHDFGGDDDCALAGFFAFEKFFYFGFVGFYQWSFCDVMCCAFDLAAFQGCCIADRYGDFAVVKDVQQGFVQEHIGDGQRAVVFNGMEFDRDCIRLI